MKIINTAAENNGSCNRHFNTRTMAPNKELQEVNTHWDSRVVFSKWRTTAGRYHVSCVTQSVGQSSDCQSIVHYCLSSCPILQFCMSLIEWPMDDKLHAVSHHTAEMFHHTEPVT